MNYYKRLKNIISNPNWNRWDYYHCHDRETIESIFKNPSEFIDWTFLHAKKHMLTSYVVDGNDRFDARKISSPRAAHSVSSFFLGFILMDGLMNGKLNRFCSFENIRVEYPFTYVWNLTSLYHDFGYQYEQDDSLKERIVNKLGNTSQTSIRYHLASIDALRKELDVKHSVWTPSFYYRKNYNRNRLYDDHHLIETMGELSDKAAIEKYVLPWFNEVSTEEGYRSELQGVHNKKLAEKWIDAIDRISNKDVLIKQSIEKLKLPKKMISNKEDERDV